MTPLHHAAVAGDARITFALIDAGGQPGATDDAGRAPLHWACANAFVGVARELLMARAKAEVADKEGFTPLHRVCQERPPEKKPKKEDDDEEPSEPEKTLEEEDVLRAEIAELLLKHGARTSTTEPAGLQVKTASKLSSDRNLKLHFNFRLHFICVA